MGKLMSFLRKGCSENCIIVEIFFFPSSNFLRKYWQKNVLALADIFPISCQWKDISE